MAFETYRKSNVRWVSIEEERNVAIQDGEKVSSRACETTITVM